MGHDILQGLACSKIFCGLRHNVPLSIRICSSSEKSAREDDGKKERQNCGASPPITNTYTFDARNLSHLQPPQ
jgi:hypothetical protein